MARDPKKPRLRVPAFLAVTTLGLASGCPGDDSTTDTGNDSGPSATTSSEPTSTTAAEVTTTSPMTDGTTVAMTTMGDTTSAGTDTGGTPDCNSIVDPTRCDNTPDCTFMPDIGGCIINCPIVTDQDLCNSQLGCLWNGTTCDFEPLA